MYIRRYAHNTLPPLTVPTFEMKSVHVNWNDDQTLGGTFRSSSLVNVYPSFVFRNVNETHIVLVEY